MYKLFLKNSFQDRNLNGDSKVWANWQSNLSFKTCYFCSKNHGRIVEISFILNNASINAHQNCKCIYVPARTKKVGSVTILGVNGADVFLKYLGKLPDYYVTKDVAKKYGWKNFEGNLNEIFPNGIIGGDVFSNDDSKLPDKNGRVWYEADINYTGGYRGKDRILYSNDGLVFVTYDHYQTFYEVIF